MYRLISSAISYSRSRLTVISCAGFVGSFPSSTAMCGGPFPQSLPTHSSPGDDVHVEVWCVLSCNDTVILNEIQAFRIVRSDESVGHPSHGPHDGDCLVVRQIKESWGVTSGDDVDLPMLKLLPVDRCHSLLGLLDDPLVLASGNCLAQETWVVRSRCRAPSRASGIGRYLNRQYGFL